MSIVCCRVSENNISIASDSISVRGYTQEKGRNKHAKLFETNGLIVGGVGYAEETSLLQIFCKTTQPASTKESDLLIFLNDFSDWKKKKTEKHGISNSYIIIFDKRAFYIYSYFINEILEYEAIGAGEEFALSALYLGHGVEKAVETACELSVYCEKPIKKMTVLKAEQIR